MPRNRPQLSITLPRNFTFHYSEDGEPKTPEREVAAPKPLSPQPYRIRRRIRPKANALRNHDRVQVFESSSDVPVPTVEALSPSDTSRPVLQQQGTDIADTYLFPLPPRRFATAPRTPSAQSMLFGKDWDRSDRANSSFDESDNPPMSAGSIFSDSSEESEVSSVYAQSLGGSCTSPESDGPDPFHSSPNPKGSARMDVEIGLDTPTKPRNSQCRPKLVYWTAEMDKHLWKAYMTYLQDPTVTPFKMLPGSFPPLGVCYRVAREAKKSWRGVSGTGGKTSESGRYAVGQLQGVQRPIADALDEIKASRSGSNTPTDSSTMKPPVWPKSGSSTRRRLRQLCKRKATIAPYYQRMIQSRSPSPFSSSSRSNSRSAHLSSPISEPHHRPSFATRDVQVALTASTATSMQPDGPLARLAEQSSKMPQEKGTIFNDPNVPWASPVAIPSSDFEPLPPVEHGMGEDLPRLGSPFGHHTWGPSRSRRAALAAAESGLENREPQTLGLRSPVQLHGTFPYPNAQKRRAQNALEDELSPGGSDAQRGIFDDLFGGPGQTGNRRVRNRGFSLGDVLSNNGQSTGAAASLDEGDKSAADSSVQDANMTDSTGVPLQAESIKRLGSPFAGISGRPSRARGRHLSSTSLSSYEQLNFASIDQRLGIVSDQQPRQ